MCVFINKMNDEIKIFLVNEKVINCKTNLMSLKVIAFD